MMHLDPILQVSNGGTRLLWHREYLGKDADRENQWLREFQSHRIQHMTDEGKIKKSLCCIAGADGP